MHYAICNIHPFSPYPDPGTTKTQCIMRIMHYNNMHYENFDCMCNGLGVMRENRYIIFIADAARSAPYEDY